MSRTRKTVLLVFCGFVLLALSARFAGIRINITHSYPPGIYLLTSDPIEKGRLVIFCPPDASAVREARDRGYIGAGFCPGGYGYMIKKIFAAQGDYVTISARGVTVNGELLPNSKPMAADTEGRALPHLTTEISVLGENDVLLMSDYSAQSFDARYFGLVDRSLVISSIRPILTSLVIHPNKQQ